MLRYVVLRHEINPDSTNTRAQASHWDLMFEDEGKLLTWAIEQLPDLHKSDEVDAIACKQLAPHRIEYLDYEGPISGDRGTVTRWDRGTFEWNARSSDKLVVKIEGEKLRGEVTLIRCPDSEIEEGNWTCLFQSLLPRPH